MCGVLNTPQASSYKKNRRVMLRTPNTKMRFVGMSLITLLKLFRRARACDVQHTFLCPYKLCNVFLFRCISLTRFCFDEYQSFL